MLELRHLLQESLVLLLRAEAVDGLDDGAVVPAPVEEDDLAGIGKLPRVALEVPLAAFLLGGDRQRDDSHRAGVQVLSEAADGAALAGGVAPLEHDSDPAAFRLDPALHLHQLDLQPFEFALISAHVDGLRHADAVAALCGRRIAVRRVIGRVIVIGPGRGNEHQAARILVDDADVPQGPRRVSIDGRGLLVLDTALVLPGEFGLAGRFRLRHGASHWSNIRQIVAIAGPGIASHPGAGTPTFTIRPPRGASRALSWPV